jgi:hypothetical protein
MCAGEWFLLRALLRPHKWLVVAAVHSAAVAAASVAISNSVCHR